MAKVKLNVRHVKQVRDNDCGIACAKMVIDYICELHGQQPLGAYSEFLCEVDKLGLYTNTHADITNLINTYVGKEIYSNNDKAKHNEIINYLNKAYPVIVGVGDNHGNEHTVVIFEYSDENSAGKEDTFKILDPLCTKDEMEDKQKVPYLGNLKISYNQINEGKAEGFIIKGFSVPNV